MGFRKSMKNLRDTRVPRASSSCIVSSKVKLKMKRPGGWRQENFFPIHVIGEKDKRILLLGLDIFILHK